ncbi:Fatty acyl-coa reductase [Thalictrum thalictroides]|uniref:Fatty acyl-CoA reductase n=1 Tax=Thalictrum thalictroides TaxID=46969 RepID=A0A7J6VBI8_THATH|nr:Fatty acyl-coa reductase [Thalictrum thalictroides]
MNSLFVHGISSTTSRLLLSSRDLQEIKIAKVTKLSRKDIRHLTISSDRKGTTSHGLNMSNKNIQLPLTNSDDQTKSSKLVKSNGIGIVHFLRGKVFLITGATGFLGKVLVEKILRMVPDVGKIYLLIKAKDKEAAMERLKNEIIDTDLFKCMEQSYGKFYKEFMLNKLVPVVGNVGEAGLGTEVGLADQIANEVDIIVHSAANTVFDQRLDVSININTLGPCRMMSFAKTCKGLKLFMHVSTAYTNGKRQGVITEKPFHMGESIASEIAGLEIDHVPHLDVEAEIKLAFDARNACTQDKMATKKMKQLGAERANLYGWHDTYAFAKAMGEMMIESRREDIPVVIIRPSTIESTYTEPIPGWIEGIRMADPLILAFGKGELTGFLANAQGVMDMIPVDMVAKTMIAAIAKHGTVRGPGLNVYNVASSVVNPLMYNDFFGYLFEYFDSSPYMDMKRGPIKVEKMKLFNTMDDFDSHIQAELVRRSANYPLQGRQSLLRRLQRSLDIAKHFASVYAPYTFYGGRFDNTNMQKLMEEMSEEEQKSFDIDVGSIDWKNYMCNIHIPGLLKHSVGFISHLIIMFNSKEEASLLAGEGGSSENWRRREIKAIKDQLKVAKEKCDNLVRYYETKHKALEKKHENLKKRWMQSIDENERLDREIASIGLSHSFKMLQLKIKYQMEADELMKPHPLEIKLLVIMQRFAKMALQRMKENQRWHEEILHRINYIEDLEDAPLRMVGRLIRTLVSSLDDLSED